MLLHWIYFMLEINYVVTYDKFHVRNKLWCYIWIYFMLGIYYVVTLDIFFVRNKICC